MTIEMLTMPGFSAEASLYKTARQYLAIATSSQRRGVTPSLLPRNGGNGNGCLADCADACSDLTGPAARACTANCRRKCSAGGGGGGSGGGGTGSGSGCTPLIPPGGSGLPIYGNYCGPGYGDPTGLTPPVDAVDAACRAHDMCYDAKGYFDCTCDRALIAGMPAAMAASPCSEGKTAGDLIMAHFLGEPCLCHYTSCLPSWLGGGCFTWAAPGGIGGIGPC
jgi:hypothetical protein